MSNTVDKNGNFSSCAWHWLPMYHDNFYFEYGNYKIGISIVSDTGYYQRKGIEGVYYDNDARKELNQFISEKDSETVLAFYIYEGEVDKR